MTAQEKFEKLNWDIKNLIESGSMSGDYDSVHEMFKSFAKFHLEELEKNTYDLIQGFPKECMNGDYWQKVSKINSHIHIVSSMVEKS